MKWRPAREGFLTWNGGGSFYTLWFVRALRKGVRISGYAAKEELLLDSKREIEERLRMEGGAY